MKSAQYSKTRSSGKIYPGGKQLEITNYIALAYVKRYWMFQPINGDIQQQNSVPPLASPVDCGGVQPFQTQTSFRFICIIRRDELYSWAYNKYSSVIFSLKKKL